MPHERKRLIVIVPPPAGQDRVLPREYEGVVLRKFKEVKFFLSVREDQTFREIWPLLEKKYETLYLAEEENRNFVIARIQDLGGCDISREDTVEEIFGHETDPSKVAIRVIQEPFDRELSLPPNSYLRLEKARKRDRSSYQLAPSKRLRIEGGGALPGDDIHPDVPIVSAEGDFYDNVQTTLKGDSSDPTSSIRNGRHLRQDSIRMISAQDVSPERVEDREFLYAVKKDPVEPGLGKPDSGNGQTSLSKGPTDFVKPSLPASVLRKKPQLNGGPSRNNTTGSQEQAVGRISKKRISNKRGALQENDVLQHVHPLGGKSLPSIDRAEQGRAQQTSAYPFSAQTSASETSRAVRGASSESLILVRASSKPASTVNTVVQRPQKATTSKTATTPSGKLPKIGKSSVVKSNGRKTSRAIAESPFNIPSDTEPEKSAQPDSSITKKSVAAKNGISKPQTNREKLRHVSEDILSAKGKALEDSSSDRFRTEISPPHFSNGSMSTKLENFVSYNSLNPDPGMIPDQVGLMANKKEDVLPAKAGRKPKAASKVSELGQKGQPKVVEIETDIELQGESGEGDVQNHVNEKSRVSPELPHTSPLKRPTAQPRKPGTATAIATSMGAKQPAAKTARNKESRALKSATTNQSTAQLNATKIESIESSGAESDPTKPNARLKDVFIPTGWENMVGRPTPQKKQFVTISTENVQVPMSSKQAPRKAKARTAGGTSLKIVDSHAKDNHLDSVKVSITKNKSPTPATSNAAQPRPIPKAATKARPSLNIDSISAPQPQRMLAQTQSLKRGRSNVTENKNGVAKGTQVDPMEIESGTSSEDAESEEEEDDNIGAPPKKELSPVLGASSPPREASDRAESAREVDEEMEDRRAASEPREGDVEMDDERVVPESREPSEDIVEEEARGTTAQASEPISDSGDAETTPEESESLPPDQPQARFIPATPNSSSQATSDAEESSEDEETDTDSDEDGSAAHKKARSPSSGTTNSVTNDIAAQAQIAFEFAAASPQVQRAAATTASTRQKTPPSSPPSPESSPSPSPVRSPSPVKKAAVKAEAANERASAGKPATARPATKAVPEPRSPASYQTPSLHKNLSAVATSAAKPSAPSAISPPPLQPATKPRKTPATAPAASKAAAKPGRPAASARKSDPTPAPAPTMPPPSTAAPAFPPSWNPPAFAPPTPRTLAHVSRAAASFVTPAISAAGKGKNKSAAPAPRYPNLSQMLSRQSEEDKKAAAAAAEAARKRKGARVGTGLGKRGFGRGVDGAGEGKGGDEEESSDESSEESSSESSDESSSESGSGSGSG